MQSDYSLRDLNGVDLLPGDEIKLYDFIMEMQQSILTEGIVDQKEDGFYLNERKLYLYDTFYITKHGTNSKI